ncbi:MAG: helix-turn-helix domain-containing protein [Kiritimatiellia bacterium]|nr:helix-turn-helix domain-containing protein [Kiritimatiellia bacterium]
MHYKVGIRLYMEFEHNRRLLEGILHYIHSGAQWQITANPFFSHHWPQILKECDGAIVQVYEKPLAKVINAMRIPVVSVVNSAFTPNLPAVINDDNAVGRMAAEYLLGLNCRTFGFVGFYYPRMWSYERGIGFVERLARAMQFIAANCRKQISVQDVLKDTPLLCRRNLERRFRNKLSCSIHEAIIRARVNKAKRSLAETNRPMAMVAELAGFSDSKKLCEHFRKTTGLTPTAYRKRCSLP